MAVALIAALAFLGGCSAVQDASNAGHRVLEAPGKRPAKLFGMLGTAAGYVVATPFTILLLPTLPFKGLTYRSSPQQDIEMPILFAPMDYCGGLGTIVAASPFLLIDHALERPTLKEQSEWPEDREGNLTADLTLRNDTP